MSRPLRSTATPASSCFSATTGRSASERRDRYSVPSVSASARSLSRPSGPTTPDDAFDARLLTFRARAADQAHAASTPGTAWPATRVAARLIPQAKLTHGFDATYSYRRFHSARPTTNIQPGASGTSSWSPPDPVKPGRFPVAHHDGLQPTQHRAV